MKNSRYTSIEESVLGDLADRMEAARRLGNLQDFELSKARLAECLRALGDASPATRQKYEHLLAANFSDAVGD